MWKRPLPDLETCFHIYKLVSTIGNMTGGVSRAVRALPSHAINIQTPHPDLPGGASCTDA